MYSRAGTALARSARYISTDWGIGTRESSWPTKNSVGVFTRAASFNGELLQYASIGASACHGEAPNQGVRPARRSVCASIEVQSAAPADDDAALNRLVNVISLFVRCPPALHPLTPPHRGGAVGARDA